MTDSSNVKKQNSVIIGDDVTYEPFQKESVALIYIILGVVFVIIGTYLLNTQLFMELDHNQIYKLMITGDLFILFGILLAIYGYYLKK